MELKRSGGRSVSVVVPVFNGERSLVALVDRLVPVLDAAADRYEILLVNDGSSDGSWDRIGELSRRPGVIGIDLMRNFGQHNALLAGIRAATMDRIVTMDDDLQHRPEDVPLLLDKLERGADVVYGTPVSGQRGLARDLASAVTKWVLRTAMGARAASDISAFRAIRREVRDAFAQYRSHDVNIDVLLTWGASHFASVRVRHDPRAAGGSTYSLRKLVGHAVNMITGFSAVPLQVASFLGFALTVFGILILAYVLGRYVVEGGSVPGFPFLASIIVIFSGAQLFAIGVIGTYLARIHFRTMDRPPYAIRRIERSGASADDPRPARTIA
ncbi:MAG: glycosyltransferase family 2 protein [Elusimicrobia bacterium]|nr:glycosyltransferase family 2 protein [Elusimicrobiota bacterium]